jgi:hypothetical protein
MRPEPSHHALHHRNCVQNFVNSGAFSSFSRLALQLKKEKQNVHAQ